MELWSSCSTAFPLKPNTPEVSHRSQIKTKILSWPARPFWSNLLLPHLTHIAPFSSLWCFEQQVLFCHRTFAHAPLSPEKTCPCPCIPFNLLTSISKSLHFSPQFISAVISQLGSIFLLLCSHPTRHFSLADLIRVVLDLGTFCTYICMIFNKKAHIIWVLGSIFTISIFAVDSLQQIFSPHN